MGTGKSFRLNPPPENHTWESSCKRLTPIKVAHSFAVVPYTIGTDQIDCSGNISCEIKRAKVEQGERRKGGKGVLVGGEKKEIDTHTYI